MKKLLLIISTFLASHAFACTDFKLAGLDGTILITRSMEFAVNMQSNIRSQPRGTLFNAVTADGKPALSWKSQYGYLYLDGMNVDRAIDGMNEKGLSFEALYLPGETQYQNVPIGQDKKALPYLFFGDWILGNFQTVEEVKAAIANANVYVFAQKVPGMGEMIFPLHFSIFDASGKGIVIEYVKGQMHLYDNQVGILTNSPTYDWQVTNLRNYLNLSAYVPQPITIAGMTFAATGQGSGSMGLPGDVSPPSRFTKIAFLLKNALPMADLNGVINLAEHIINNVDIPTGTVRAKLQNAADSNEYTQWVVMKDLIHRVLYYRSYNDLTLHSIDMGKIDFSETAAHLKMPVDSASVIIDDTSKFMNKK